MNRRSVITMTVLGLALLPGSAVSQQQSHACLLPACESLKQQLVGTWTLVSYERVFPDGRKLHLMGANPKGINIFEPNGHYVRILARSDLPRFASGDHMKATPEEAKAMVEGMVASYGTYTVDARGGKRANLRIDFSSANPGLVGASVERVIGIRSLTADELKEAVPGPVYEGEINLVWKRTK